MSDISKIASASTADFLKQKEKISTSGSKGEAFAKHLESALNEVNDLQQNAQEAEVNIATGQVKDLHQAALAINKAETSMKLMLEIRNKALNAYKEIGRTQL